VAVQVVLPGINTGLGAALGPYPAGFASHIGKYSVTFSAEGSDDQVFTVTGDAVSTEQTQLVLPGTYTVKVDAYFTGSLDTVAATGTKTGVTVNAGSNSNIEMSLGPASGGTGTMSYSVTLDAGLSGATATITVSTTAGEVVKTDADGHNIGSNGVINATPATGAYGTAKTGTLSLPSGQYLVQTLVTEASPGTRTRGHNDVLNIYRGLTTDLNYSFDTYSWDNDVDDFDLSQYIPKGTGGRRASKDFIKQSSQYTLSNLLWTDAGGNTISEGSTFDFATCKATVDVAVNTGWTFAAYSSKGPFTYGKPNLAIVKSVDYDAANKKLTVTFAPVEGSINLSAASPASCDAYTWDATNKIYTIADDAKVTVTGSTTERHIALASGAASMLILNNASIDVYNAGGTALDGSNATVYLSLQGTNSMKSGHNVAGIQCPSGSTLNISGTGSLYSQGGEYSAGIGSRHHSTSGKISITGSVTVHAVGGELAAGIGNGSGTSTAGPEEIYIADGAIVLAQGTSSGSEGGPGIGGGSGSPGGKIIIKDATVFAQGNNGAGIGSGDGATGNETILIQNSVVYTAANGTSCMGIAGAPGTTTVSAVTIQDSLFLGFGESGIIGGEGAGSTISLSGSTIIGSGPLGTSNTQGSGNEIGTSVAFASSIVSGITQDADCVYIAATSGATVANSAAAGTLPSTGTITLAANLDLKGQTLIIPAGWTLDCDTYTVTGGTVKLAPTLTMPDGTVLAAGQMTNAGAGSVTAVTE
jgi:hypothetical protein